MGIEPAATPPPPHSCHSTHHAGPVASIFYRGLRRGPVLAHTARLLPPVPADALGAHRARGYALRVPNRPVTITPTMPLRSCRPRRAVHRRALHLRAAHRRARLPGRPDGGCHSTDSNAATPVTLPCHHCPAASPRPSPPATDAGPRPAEPHAGRWPASRSVGS